MFPIRNIVSLTPSSILALNTHLSTELSTVGMNTTKPKREMQQLGHSLRSLREDFGFSMHEVARRTSFTPSYISKLEQGDVFQTVTVQTLRGFSDVYHIPIQVLLEKAGFVEEEEGLPGLTAYLKAKYHVSHQASQEMEFAWEIVQKKYLLQKHRQP